MFAYFCLSKTTTTLYIGGAIYENDQLQFIGHEEGRIRPVRDANNNITGFVYDYFLKDHLGNVRMVLTEEQKIDHYPTATLEGTGTGSPVENEKSYYDINNSYVQDQPASLTTSYINDNGTNNPSTFGNRNATSLKMYRLNAATNRTGLGMLLKVMSGDKINILGKSYYHYSGSGVNNTPFDASALISAFLSVGGSSNIALIHGATTTALNANTVGTVVPLNAFSNSNPVDPNNNVKAGIAYILFDEQFKYAGGGFDPVDGSASGGLKSHVLPTINVPKNGYIYIYCSNESNIDVFFDNLEVVDTKGPILEETHYYPFGLTMAGISSKALNNAPENKIKLFGKELQNKEFADGSGLEWYDYGMREYDQQLGRFFRVDPITERFYESSPYQYCFNNPIKNVDLDGLEGLNFNIFNKLIENTVKNPNGTSAKVLGTVTGIGGAVTNVVTGTANAFRHPIQTGKGLMRMLSQTPEQNAADYAVNVTSQYVGTGSDAFTNYAIGAHVLTDIGMALSPMKEFIPGGGKSIWELAPSARGFAAEKILGGNLPDAFPVIDKFADGVATSIKSIDLTAASYTKGNGLFNTLKGYINKLDDFTGAQRGRTVIESSDITSKVLEVAVQPGKASLSQWEQIGKAMQYAKDNNIQFNLQFIK